MGTEETLSKFASPARSAADLITKENRLILQHREYSHILDAFPEIVLVLDKNRQAVYAGKRLLDFLKADIKSVLGKRPGEIFNCVHAHEEAAGCGTSSACRYCGAVESILTAQKGTENYAECRISIKHGDIINSLDLGVWSIPLEVEKEPFVLFSIKDIAHQKRREMLERTFFHDVMNEAAVLIGNTELIADGLAPNDINAIRRIRDMSRMVVGTIQEQRALLAAEEGTLQIEDNIFDAKTFLEELTEFYRSHKLARDKKIDLNYEGSVDEKVKTDRAILQRVIGNLIKNALEATTAGSTVTVSYKNDLAAHYFSVHNKEVMPESVRLQIFQRSFSTKGKGRGVGTYSVKFLTEQYLKGSVSFSSKDGDGTIFTVSIGIRK